MLYIIEKGKKGKQWHVGETLPSITTKVVTFQADGDELEVIVEALKNKSKT